MNSKRLIKILGITLGAGALIGLGATFARAVPGRATKSKLSFSGNVSPTPAAGTDVAFKFTNGSATCTPPALKPTFASNGDFAVELDLSSCSTFFDGGDVTYTIKVGTAAESAPQALNPVPYAKYADRAVTASTATNASTAATASTVAWTGVTGVTTTTPWPGKVVVTNGTVSSTTVGKYCGKSTPTTGKATEDGLTGYRAIKAKCEKATGCGATAHICTVGEMALSAQIGIPLGFDGYVSALSYAKRADGAAGTLNDCNGWTADTGGDVTYWYGTGGSIVNGGGCNTSFPVLCCE